MKVDEIHGAISDALTIEDLSDLLTRVIGNYGFSSFTFMDLGEPSVDEPWLISTINKKFVSDYHANGFIHDDAMHHMVRRTNTAFTWHDVVERPSEREGRFRCYDVMDAAYDYGYRDGLVIPFHFVDGHGRFNSASGAFFWEDDEKEFQSVVDAHKGALNLIMLHWSQRAMQIASAQGIRRDRLLQVDAQRNCIKALSAREKDVLGWAAQGQTVAETAEYLSLSNSTVKTHLRNAIKKLGAANKTHAVVKALFQRQIDF